MFIEISRRCVHFAGGTAHPNAAWIGQQARPMGWELSQRDPNLRFRIRDHDQKFTATFGAGFRSEGVQIIPTPVRAPNANAFMERWIGSARGECLDTLWIINEAHLRRVMCDDVAFFNPARIRR